MDIKKTKILLEKINSLYKSIRLDDAPLAGIERDLMLSYLRQLYDEFQQPAKTGTTLERNEKTASRPADEPSHAGPRKEPPKREPEPKSEPQGRSYQPPRIIEIPDSIKELTAKVAETRAKNRPSEPSRPKADPLPRHNAPQPEPKKDPMAGGRTQGGPSIDKLLDKPRTNELSERLSQSPVKDLLKAMAINDRLLYTNELFGKDARAMENAVNLLNKFESLEEAKGLLADLAHEFKWSEGARANTARDFLKLVQRRYL